MASREMMQALRAVEYQKPFEFREVPIPTAGPGDVVIKVGGPGTCGSDLRFMSTPQEKSPFKLPFTVGHEPAGWV